MNALFCRGSGLLIALVVAACGSAQPGGGDEVAGPAGPLAAPVDSADTEAAAGDVASPSDWHGTAGLLPGSARPLNDGLPPNPFLDPDAPQMTALSAANYPANCYNSAHSYTIQVRTGSAQGSGTDAHVYLQFRGRFGNQASTWTPVLNLNSPADDFERGSLFSQEYPGITSPGEINRIRLWHDNSGSNAGWYVADVTITDHCAGREYTTSISLWLATSKAPLYATSVERDITSVSEAN